MNDDNRSSAECATECQAGTCSEPRLPGLACGSCCQCLGGCVFGWFEQIEETATEATDALVEVRPATTQEAQR